MATKTAAALAIWFGVVTAALPAAEERLAKPVGTWERKVGDTQVTFHFKADGLRLTVKGGGADAEVDADYGVARDGTLFGIVNEMKKDGAADDQAKGHLFSFRFTADNEKLTISDLKGTDNDEHKQLIEGEYKKIAGKKEK